MKGEALKGRKDWRGRKMWRLGEGRWLPVCRGLAACDGEEKMFKKQWLATPLSLSLSLPLSTCDSCRLQGGEGSRLCRLSDGWSLHGGTFMCVYAVWLWKQE